jgi:predicted RNase H-like HicB family nuclease
MAPVRFIYWQDGPHWLGHLEEYPDYLTQGESLDELKENLKDLLLDLTSGEIRAVRRVGELHLA